MAITDYIPNVFGQAAPSYLGGLLGAEETQNLQNRANVQGLLGAGLALAQGMSRTGPRRSAAENILGALAGGFGAAGGAYEQGVKNYVTQQQIAQTQLAQTQAANKLRSIAEAKRLYPDLAPLADIDPGKFAEEVGLRARIKGISGTQAGQEQTPEGLRAIAQQYYAGGPNFKALGDSYMEQAKRLEMGKLATLTGNESPAQLFALSRTAAANGNKELADQFAALAEQKQLQPSQAPAVQPTAKQPAPVQPRLEPGLSVTSKGDTFNGVPNYAAGERYVDEAMHQKALELQKTLPPTVVQASGKLGQLQSDINNIDAELARVQDPRITPPTEANTRYQTNLKSRREILLKDIDRYSVMEYDFTDLKSLPNKYQAEVKQLEKQAQGGTLDSNGLNSRIQQIYTRIQEDEKGRALTGNAAVFAQMKFGVTDRTKLSGPQLAEILRFEDAPNATQSAELAREALKLRADVGVAAPLPAARGPMIFAPIQRADQQPPAQITARQGAVTTTQPVTTTQQVPTTTQAEPAKSRTGSYSVVIADKPVNFDKINQNALINKPENILPLRDRQKLEQAKPATENLTRYTLRNIVDARNSAKELLSNDRYLEALSSRSAKLKSGDVFGVAIDQETAAANSLLQNLLTRSFVTNLQEMRTASPTGGAVGNVAVAEMEALSRIQAAIQLGMPKAEIIRQLQQYVNVSERAMRGLPLEFGKTYTYQGEFNDILEGNVIPQKPAKDQLSPAGRAAYDKYKKPGQ